MFVIQTPSKSNVSLPPLSSILLNNNNNINININNTVDNSINNTSSDSFSIFSKTYDTSLNNITSTPILTKSKSFPSNHLPMPIQLPNLHYSLQNIHTLNNSNKLPLLSTFKDSTLPNFSTISNLNSNSNSFNAPITQSTPLRKSLPILHIKKIDTTDIFNDTTNNNNITTISQSVSVSANLSSSSKTTASVTTPISTTSTSSTLSASSTSLSSTPKKKRNLVDESKSFAFISHSQKTFLSNEPDIDNARLARRKRRRTSPIELSILKEEFKKGMTPNKQRRISIAEKVDMSEKAVQIWFQNKRQSLRKSQNVLMSNNCENSSISTSISNNNSDTDDENKENDNLIDDDKDKDDENKFSIITPNNSIIRKPLNDITNSSLLQNSPTSQTFKFKSTDFGLINHNSSNSRKQKPIMKLKMKKEIISK